MRPSGATLLALLLLTGARGASPAVVTVDAGLDNQAVARHGLPVKVQITASDAPVQGRIEIPAGEESLGEPIHIYTAAVDVPAGGTKTWWLTIWPPDFLPRLRLRLVESSGRRQETTVQPRYADEDDHLIGVVSVGGGGLRFLRREPKGSADSQNDQPARWVANLTVADLPPQAAGYDSLQALILADPEVTTAREAVQAIANWVEGGGHLIIVGGVANAGLLQNATLARLAPVRVDGLRLASAAELTGGSGPRYAVSNASPRPGAQRLLVRGQPFVATWSLGQGRVSFLLAAHDQPPLAAWDGQPAMWERVLALPVRGAPPDLAALGLLPALKDLATAVPASQAPALTLLGGFLALYLVVLVPVQLGVLKRLDRRELAWLVTPLIAAVFTLGAWLLGLRLKGGEVIGHTASLVTARSGERTAEAEAVAALYSPAHRRYQVRLPHETRRVTLLAEGGYDYRGEGPPPRNLVIESTPTGLRLPELEVEMWALRLVRLQHPLDLQGAVELRWRNQRPPLQITVRNGLGHTLHAPQVAYQRFGSQAPQCASLGADLRPGEQRTLTPAAWALAETLWPPALSKFQPKDFVAPADLLERSIRGEPAEVRTGEPTLTLWSWVELEGGPLRLGRVPHKARQLWLLRVYATPPGTDFGVARNGRP